MDFIQSSIEANREIYKFINSNLDSSYFEYEDIGFGGDRGLKIDRVAEEIFVKHLFKFGEIISEESGYIGSKSEYKIVLDPIDGSDNLLSSFPYYGTSVALVDSKNRVLAGVISNLATGEIFVKSLDFFKRFTIDGVELKINSSNLSNIGLFEKSYSNSDVVKRLEEFNLKFRSPGAIALSLAYARFVNFVIFFGKIRDFDVKAGLFMCEDLHISILDNMFFVSRDREIFNRLEKILV